MMNIAFRTDASLQIGTGHVMRCLTLADELRQRGAKISFICRELPGNLIGLIEHKGYSVLRLPPPAGNADAMCYPPLSCNGGLGGISSDLMVRQNVNLSHNPRLSNGEAVNSTSKELAHAAWLGTDWITDAEQTSAALGDTIAEWLIVDHYALDARWESALKSQYHKLMVIDDLADRIHDCDIFLDQNMTEGMEARYLGKVPTNCTCLIGPQYSLLRPEFNALRASSLARRKSPALERLLICMGGSDAENETGKVIAGIKLSKRRWKHIDVVVGQAYPYIAQLKESLASLSSASLHIQTSNMAELMAAADWAVTAGGSMTWEKCVLGLPSLVVILGENQSPIATKMHELGAQKTLGIASNLTPADYAKHLDEIQTHELQAMIDRASAICDGTGTEKVLNLLTDHL